MITRFKERSPSSGLARLPARGGAVPSHEGRSSRRRGIGEYTRHCWGDAQAVRYLTGLDACFFRIADGTGAGRVSQLPYLRLEYVSHVVFFRRETNGDAIIVRVLHQRMLPELHLESETDDEREEQT
jgi:toxin ParE1/3/4